jgi:hypothetical protein
MYGQRVKVTVKDADGKACVSPCMNGACVTSTSKSLATGATEYPLKPRANSNYWGVGPYAELEVEVGDSVLFQTGAGFHDVATVPSKAGFEDCNMAGKTVVADWTYGTQDPSTACKSSKDCCADSSCSTSGNYVTYVFNATSAGDTYFVCSVGSGGHCKGGQKLLVKARVPTASTNGAASFGTVAAKPVPIIWLCICLPAVYIGLLQADMRP